MFFVLKNGCFVLLLSIVMLLHFSCVDVSILVTEPSPETPVDTNSASPKTVTGSTASLGGRLHIDGGGMGCGSTLVHVLVHRESEEYQTDLEDNGAGEGSSSTTGKIVRVWHYNCRYIPAKCKIQGAQNKYLNNRCFILCSLFKCVKRFL